MSSFNIKNDITWRDFLIRLGLITVTVTIIVWMMPRSSQNNLKIEKGRPWIHTDLKAPFDFPIYKSETAVKAERDSLMRLYLLYYEQRDRSKTAAAVLKRLLQRHTRTEQRLP